MTLEELFAVVSDEQEVRLYGDGFDDFKAFKATLEAVLTKRVMRSTVDCVEASFEGELKVWIKDGGERKAQEERNGQ